MTASALTVRHASAGERDAIVTLLGDAFFDDPVMRVTVPQPAERRTLAGRSFARVDTHEPDRQIAA